MSREKKAKYMINYLEKRINCENVMKFIDKIQTNPEENKLNINKLLVENIPVALKIINYNDTDIYIRKNKSDPKDKIWIKNLFDTFDFMTEANYTGFEYFPYLYGVLDCHDRENSKVYIFYELFDGSLIDLLNKMEHPSEWYDIIFQMAMMNYYIEIMNGYRYNNGKIKNHLYKKIDKPYYKEYHIDSYNFNIYHRYLIVLWDMNYIEKMTIDNENQIVSNIDFLLEYLDKEKEKIKIPPSERIIKLLYDIKNNIKDTINILSRYYIQKD